MSIPSARYWEWSGSAVVNIIEPVETSGSVSLSAAIVKSGIEEYGDGETIGTDICRAYYTGASHGSITLPSVASVEAGHTLSIKADNTHVTVAADGGDDIDGDPAIDLFNYDSYVLYSDGATTWRIESSY